MLVTQEGWGRERAHPPLPPPKRATVPCTPSEDPGSRRAAAGQLPLEDIRFAGGDLKYVLLVLAHGTTRAQLEAIQPDFGALLDVVSQDEVHGVIVTCAAGAWHGGARFGQLRPWWDA